MSSSPLVNTRQGLIRETPSLSEEVKGALKIWLVTVKCHADRATEESRVLISQLAQSVPPKSSFNTQSFTKVVQMVDKVARKELIDLTDLSNKARASLKELGFIIDRSGERKGRISPDLFQ